MTPENARRDELVNLRETGVSANQFAIGTPFDPLIASLQRKYIRCIHDTTDISDIAGGNSGRNATHPRALVITGAVAPASIFLVLSPIIQAKPPNSHSNTHRGPARNTRRRAPMSEKRRARSFDLSAPRTPLKPALRHGVSPLHRRPTHRNERDR